MLIWTAVHIKWNLFYYLIFNWRNIFLLNRNQNSFFSKSLYFNFTIYYIFFTLFRVLLATVTISITVTANEKKTQPNNIPAYCCYGLQQYRVGPMEWESFLERKKKFGLRTVFSRKILRCGSFGRNLHARSSFTSLFSTEWHTQTHSRTPRAVVALPSI